MTSAQVTLDRPWVGLQSFTEETALFFFGRTEEIQDLLQRVLCYPLTILYSASGLGKTSLLRAGLIPRLRSEAYCPILVRLGYSFADPPLSEQIQIAFARMIAPTSEDYKLTKSFWEIFHHKSCPKDLTINPPVLILDQFEEIFTLGQQSRPVEAQDLLRQLAELVENRPPTVLCQRFQEDRALARAYDFAASPLRIVLSLREDYLYQLDAWRSAMPSIMHNRMPLRLLNGPQALEAVVRPGRREGRDLVSDVVGARIVCFVAKCDPGTPLKEIGTVPPLLSLLCEELNEARLAVEAPAITAGQVDQQSADILINFYARAFDGLPPAARRLVEDRFITVSGHRSTVAYEDAYAELIDVGVLNPSAALDQLIHSRLLSTEERGGLQRLELTHDVLAPVVRESRDRRKEVEVSERAARTEAPVRDREEQAHQERNRLRNLTAVFASLTLLAIASAIIACLHTQEAKVAVAKAVDTEKRSLILLQEAEKKILLLNKEIREKAQGISPEK